MAVLFSLLLVLVAAQKTNVTTSSNATVTSNSTTTFGNSTSSNNTQVIPTTNTFNETQAFDNLSPQCQAAVKKYNGTTPQGCSNIPQQSTNFNVNSNELYSINSQELDGICVPACQASVKQMASDISAACSNDNPSYQYLSPYMTAYFDVLCVKDGSQYCVVEEIQAALAILQQGKSALDLVANTTFVCTKCIYQQLTSLDSDIKSFPSSTQQQYNSYVGMIKGECTSQFQKYASSAMTYSASVWLVGALVSVF
ncbi:hypothetical protein HDV06_005524 [Boothiomyces sp. JEL0866]|nr:hypothetical protein HDV06_005524 [Boothiomyces sp. JEL0866]